MSDIVSNVFEFGWVKTIGLQGIDDPVHIAKVIIEKWTLYTCRQRIANIAYFFSDGIPNISHFIGLRVVLELKNDLRLARFGVTADLVCIRGFLQRALEFVSDLLGHLLRCRAWPVSSDHHGTKRERRVFVLPQLKIRCHAEQQQHDHQVACESAVIECPLR